MAIPTWSALGTSAVATNGASISPAWPTHATNDIAFLLIKTNPNNDTSVTLTTAAGFALVGEWSGGGAVRYSVYWCRATSSSMGAPTAVGTAGGAAIFGVITTISGCITTGTPYEGVVGAYQGPVHNVPGSTTLGADRLVFVSMAMGGQETTSAWTNAGLSSLTQRIDINTATAPGGCFGAATGGLAVAGTYGTTTFTNVPAVDDRNAYATFGLIPGVAAPIIVKQLSAMGVG